MKIPPNAIIPWSKLTEYLLVPRQRNDKAKFLAQAGFTTDNPAALERAIRTLITLHDATPDRHDAYGIFYQATGDLIGPHGILTVVTVWLLRTDDGLFRFVTLNQQGECDETDALPRSRADA